MTDSLKYQIALSLIKGIGPKLARNIIAYIGSVEEFFAKKKLPLEKVPGIGSITASMLNSINKKELLNSVEEEINFVVKHDIKTLYFLDDNYPRRLSLCDDAPLILYVKGDLDLDSPRIVSIVGTRRATEYGMTYCEKFIGELAKNYPDTIIVSGLAYGIDAAAHRGAFRYSLPTVAVLAHGLDRIYPPAHSNLAREMLYKGAVLTEFMTKTTPDRQNFIKRNRIIAGLADAVIVAESAKKGGALITARIANSYNREVFTFPGRINDDFSQGCNNLIKTNQAHLLESVEDFAYIMGWETKSTQNKVEPPILFQPESDEEKALMDILLVEKEMNVNLLAQKCELTISKTCATLLGLEFRGFVKCSPGGLYKLRY
ncbi:MAG: DNA-processing protein DprA [Marinilabiliaceae bacterium]|nr:DNA-processing protein DprA [Marinilabiliaceae bacterium]